MLQLTTLKQFSTKYSFLPVSISESCQQFDPFKIVNHFDHDQRHSMVFSYDDDRYTVVVVKPEKIITAKNGVIKLTDAQGVTTVKQQNPVDFLNQYYQRHQMPKMNDLPSFACGLIGYFSYDFVRYAKHVRLPQVNDQLGLNDLELFEPNITILYDNHTQDLTLVKMIASENLEHGFERTQKELLDKLAHLKNILKQPLAQLPALKLTDQFKTQFDLAEFTKRVKIAQQHIHQGDIFQLILSNPYTAKMTGSLITLGYDLYYHNHSPYHFYFANGDFDAVGASPETLIKKTGNQLFSYPLAGTRRRGHTQEEDDRFAHELQTSPKELSEHNMLVDLGRNDLGQVSKLGSVTVTKLRNLLKFSQVMHLGSKIESVADPQFTPVDIISATLPAGTLSGAPKVSAMTIINQLEQRKRGIYGGGIGFIDFAGNLDLCIGIRLAYQKRNQLVVHAGAGIVKDSDARQEFHEFGNKSRLMLTEINKLNQGVDTNAFIN